MAKKPAKKKNKSMTGKLSNKSAVKPMTTGSAGALSQPKKPKK